MGNRWALFGISLLAFTAYLDLTIVNTALPFIQVAFDADIVQLQWIANIFPIVQSLTMIPVGWLGDRLGRKRVYSVGILLFALGALGAGFCKSVAPLVLVRGVQAVGASTLFIVSESLLSEVFAHKGRLHAISIYGGVTGLGLLMGPVLGGMLVQWLDWRWVFWINLPLIGMGWAALSRNHAEEPVHEKEGFLLTLFRHPLMLLAILSSALAGVISTVFLFFDPLYLRIVRQFSPLQIGVLVAAIPAAQSLMSLGFHRAVTRFGSGHLLFGSTLTGFGAICLHRTFTETTPVPWLLVPFLLLGVNWGLSNSATLAAVNEVMPPRKIGAAVGTIATIWNVVGALLLGISTAVFRVGEGFLTDYYRMVNLNIAFAALLVIGAFIAQKKMRKMSL